MSDTATLTPAVPKPSHIPDSAVYDFDLFADPALLADAHTRILDIARNAPSVFRTATHPDLQAKLRANPKLIVEATEEILRRYTFTVPPRWVAKDMEFEGVSMMQGERALLFLPAADLDDDEFAKPDTFDLERENKVHIAFGTGPHRCLGSHLARIELQILYEEMLARLPEFRLDPDKPVTYHGGHVLGPEKLHLIWEKPTA